MTTLAALLLDVDGTLANTEYVHLKAFNLAFDEAGLDWHWSVDLYIELLRITGGQERIHYFIKNYVSEFDTSISQMQFVKKLHQIKTKFYDQQVRQGDIQLRPGVERILKEAREEKVRLAIVTTTSPENINSLFSSTLGKEALEWFEVIGAGNVVANKKPAPDIYNYVLERMNLSPEACIAIEDSDPGVRSANAAHVPVIATMNEFTSGHNFNEAALLLDNLGEPDAYCRVIDENKYDIKYVDLNLINGIHSSLVACA